MDRLLGAFVLLSFATAAAAPAGAARPPRIEKRGTIACDLVETTPFVFKGRVYRLQWVRTSYKGNRRGKDYLNIVDRETGREVAALGEGHRFASAYARGDTVYVLGTKTEDGWYGHTVTIFRSEDLRRWESWTALDDPRYGICNTSLCEAGGRYVLCFEIHRPKEETGVAFTARFATSGDLRAWTITPPACVFTKDRYSAPHCLRYQDGWYYLFYLESLPGRYEQYVVRSRDLVRWIPSPLNPVLRPSDEDRRIANPALTEAERKKIAAARDINNSDIDLCEFEGRLIIDYSWGDQQGTEFLAEAIYDGTLAAFLRAWFPESGPRPARPDATPR